MSPGWLRGKARDLYLEPKIAFATCIGSSPQNTCELIRINSHVFFFFFSKKVKRMFKCFTENLKKKIFEIKIRKCLILKIEIIYVAYKSINKLQQKKLNLENKYASFCCCIFCRCGGSAVERKTHTCNRKLHPRRA